MKARSYKSMTSILIVVMGNILLNTSLFAKEVLVIDKGVSDYQFFVDNVKEGIDIIFLESDGDELSQMASALQKYQALDAIHVVSHGVPGELSLGKSRLTNDAITRYSAEMRLIGNTLNQNADILLYACDVAKGIKGQAFISALATATKADVIASNNSTGAAKLGGDWALEKRIGEIESSLAFPDQAIINYSALLAAFSETFDVDPTGNMIVTSFSTTLDGVLFDYTFTLDGDGGDFTHELTNGDGGTDSINAISLGVASPTPEKITIVRNDGLAFTFNSIFINNTAGQTITVGGYKNNSLVGLSQTVGNGLSSTLNFGGIGVDEVRLTSLDFLNTNFDTFNGDSVDPNVAPSISINNTNLAYTENDLVTQVDSFAILTDPNGDSDWNGGTLVAQITANNEAADELSLPDNVVGVINTSATNLRDGAEVIGTLSAAEGTVTSGTALTITFNANATNARVQQVLRAIHYRNTSDAPGTANRTVTFTATDNSAAAAVDTRTIVVTANNDDPTETGTFPTDIFVSEDLAGNFDLSGLTLADVDAGVSNVVMTLTASTGTLAATTVVGVTIGGSGTGTLTMTGTIADIDSFLNTVSNIQYTGASNVSGNDAATVAVKINDGGNTGNGGGLDVALGTVNMDIAAVNDAPTDITLSSASINQTATGVGANVGNLTTTDVDDIAFTYSLVTSGTAPNGLCGVGNDVDNGNFQITGASFETNGALTPGSYKACVQTNDGGTIFEKAFTITVVDNVGPTISAVSIPNNAHKVGDTVTATITVNSDTDDYTTGLGGITGTIDGYTLGGFSKTNNTTYTATFTVTNGGTDVAAGANVAVNITLDDSLGNTSAAYTTAISQASDAIYANLPTVNLTASTNTLAEDGGTSTLTGTLSGSLNNQWPVNVAVNLAYSGTATLNTDYTGAAAITIASGSSTGTTVVTSLADTVLDAAIAETIIVGISSVSVGNIGITNQQTLSITDAELAPTTTLSVGNATVAENGGTSTITATLSTATYADVTVTLGYSGTATLAGTDASTPSGSITIPAGSTSANAVTGVTSINDASPEGNETVIVDITSVAGGSATESGVQQQTVTITDDDVPNVSLSVSASPIAEAAGTSTITATLDQATFADVTVTLGYTGTATDVSDYTKTNTITVLTGNLTGTTTLTAVQDTISEPGETVIIDITGVAGGAAVENGVQQQTVTITDDDPATVSLSASPTLFGEAGTSTLTATLNQATFANVTVNLGYTGTATTATDYTAAGSITVAAGQTTGSTTVSGVADAITEGPETVIVEITGVSGGNGAENGVQQLTLTLSDDNPALTVPADITVDAEGLFTAVPLGVASANDTIGNALTPTSDAPDRFRPGVTEVTWSVTDAAGNTSTAIQTVNVRPQVSFSKDQIVAEGSSVTFRAILNGDAVAYPVNVPYTVSGTASTDGSDHTLTDGSVTIAAGTEAVVNFLTVDDGPNEGLETIVVTMGVPSNAVVGPNATHQIDLSEDNVAPTLSLIAEQAASKTLTAIVDAGPVIVTSSVLDPNVADGHSYDWSATDNALIDTDLADETFTFDPSVLAPGLYTVRLTVSDNAAATDADAISLEVLATAPLLSAADTDGDSIDDQTEGFGDDDFDGIPDYLDAIAADNVLQQLTGQSSRYLMETEPGLALRLGSVAFQTGKAQSSVSTADITAAGTPDDDLNQYDYGAGRVDFVVSGLPVTGQSITLVVTQQAPVPANAVYRKFANGGWQDFVVDTDNAVASALGEQGYCPPPGDAAYVNGLTAGHWCVQLTIQDGGRNDADGVANNKVVDPSGVAGVISSSGDGSGGSGGASGGGGGGGCTIGARGGSLDPLVFLWILGLWLVRRRVQSKGTARSPQG